MSTIEHDPFYHFLQETGPMVASAAYVNGLIKRLMLADKGTPIERHDYPVYSETICYCIEVMETAASEMPVTENTSVAVASVLGLADTLYQQAIKMGFLDQDGWVHTWMREEFHNPLLDFQSPTEGATA